MNIWKKKLDISDLWKNGEIPHSELPTTGKIIASRLKRMYPDWDDIDVWGFELRDIIEGFDNLLSVEEWEKDPSDYCLTPVEDFDARMAELYDFGDVGKRLWVQTR